MECALRSFLFLKWDVDDNDVVSFGQSLHRIYEQHNASEYVMWLNAHARRRRRVVRQRSIWIPFQFYFILFSHSFQTSRCVLHDCSIVNEVNAMPFRQNTHTQRHTICNIRRWNDKCICFNVVLCGKNTEHSDCFPPSQSQRVACDYLPSLFFLFSVWHFNPLQCDTQHNKSTRWY